MEENSLGYNSIETAQKEHWSKKRHPYVGGIELTEKCNLNCVHCYLQGLYKGSDMTTDEVLTAIDKLYEEGVLFLYFTGGEILSRKDFKTIYVYAKKKGFIIELLTNGTLITEDIIEIFNMYPPATVSISMYGKDNESYDKVTRTKGNFDKLTKGIKLLKDNGIHFEIKFIGVKENKGDYFAVKKIAEDYGAVFSSSFEMFPTLSGDNITLQHMLELEDIIEIEKKDEKSIALWANYKKFSNPFKDRYDVPLFLCDMAVSNFLIDHEGYINPCHKCRFKEFNIMNNSLSDAWKYYAKYREMKAPKTLKCLQCDYIMLCNPCLRVNYLNTGSYTEVPDIVCKLTKMRIFEFSKKIYDKYRDN